VAANTDTPLVTNSAFWEAFAIEF